MEKKEKVNQITEGVIWKQLLLFFFPIVFGTFFQQIYNTADTIVVGRFVGKQALAAVGGSASQIANLIIGFFVGLSSDRWTLCYTSLNLLNISLIAAIRGSLGSSTHPQGPSLRFFPHWLQIPLQSSLHKTFKGQLISTSR